MTSTWQAHICPSPPGARTHDRRISVVAFAVVNVVVFAFINEAAICRYQCCCKCNGKFNFAAVAVVIVGAVAIVNVVVVSNANTVAVINDAAFAVVKCCCSCSCQ